MRRREFIALLGGAAAAWSLAARAQQVERMRRIGVLMAITDNEEGRVRIAAFRDELHRLGRVEGRNIQIEIRWAAGDKAKLQDFAKELVSLKPDIILANTTPAARALQLHTSEIPIVFVFVADPVGDRLVTNLARPGGNLTGFTSFEFSVASKWLRAGVLREDAPAGHAAPPSCGAPRARAWYPASPAGAPRSLGRTLSVQTVPLRASPH